MNEKYPNLITQLSAIFESELAQQIAQYPIIEVGKEVNLNQGCTKSKPQFIPIVIKGSVRTLRYDPHGKEILIYNIDSGQSCILSITSALQQRMTTQIEAAITNEETAMILIPIDKAEEWMDIYKSWRKFTIELYERRLNELVKQHQLISNQRDVLSKQKDEITASIQYAQRIQQAVLPPEELMESLLPEHFVLYKPRDIVSGDYYWMSQIEHKTILAVADCTGHGVPGAFMSMLGVSLLNQAVSHNELKPVNEILEELRQNVKKSLRQTGKDNEAKDGMDMALMIFDFETQILEYAGAYNPLYIIRQHELIELKPDRMPIGVYLLDKRKFKKHTFQFQSQDIFYAFSDGYIDQFGGEYNRKFMTTQFKQLLKDIHQKSMSEQKELLEATIEQWRGKQEQIDDILVVGIKI